MRAMRVAREEPQLLPLRVPGEGRLTSIYLATDDVERVLRRSADFSLRLTYYLQTDSDSDLGLRGGEDDGGPEGVEEGGGGRRRDGGCGVYHPYTIELAT